MTVTVFEEENQELMSREMKDGKEKKNKERKEEVKPEKRKIIRIFSLNVWGIPFGISKNKSERIQAIIQSLIREPYDYVFLQEVWDKRDYNKLSVWLTTSVLPYSHYFGNSGTCIFSSTPLEETEFYPYSLCGYPHKIFHGDWFAGKGLGLCKTEFEGIPIMLVNSHFHAAYQGEDYLAHRLCQAFEASQKLKETTINHHLAIFGTDFNSEPIDIPYKIFIHSSGFEDSFLTSKTKPPTGTEITSGNSHNSYTTPNNEKRIDYILYRHTEDYEVEVLTHDHPLPAKVPFKDFSYSDHEALRTVIAIERKSDANFDDSSSNGSSKSTEMFGREKDIFLEAYNICDKGLQNALRYQLLWFWVALLANGLFAGLFVCFWFFSPDRIFEWLADASDLTVIETKDLIKRMISIFENLRYNHDTEKIKNFFLENKVNGYVKNIVNSKEGGFRLTILHVLSSVYENPLFRAVLIFLLLFCVMLFFFSLYMSIISAKRECNSLRKTKNFIFQTVFKVACENSNHED